MIPVQGRRIQRQFPWQLPGRDWNIRHPVRL